MYLALHQCASSVNTVQCRFSTTSGKHFQAGCLTKRFKRQAECTLLFTIVLRVLTLCQVRLVQRVGNIFKLVAWPSVSSVKLSVPCSSPLCFRCYHCASRSSTTSRKHFQAWLLDQAFQASSWVYLALHHCASGVNTVQSLFSIMSRKHLQVVRLTKLFKHQASCTLLFTNVLQVLTLCNVDSVQRVGNIFNMAAWPSVSSVKLGTLFFTIVLQVLALCKVCLVQRVGHIFNMAAWPTFSSIKLGVPCSSPMCFKC